MRSQNFEEEESDTTSRAVRSQPPQQPLGLLTLPAELRHQVWQLAMHREWNHGTDLYDGIRQLRTDLAPFTCCRQMLHEAQTYLDQSQSRLLQDTHPQQHHHRIAQRNTTSTILIAI